MTQNMAASVRQQLLNLSRQTGESFQNLLVRYANERLLFRVSHSKYAENFILKGANLFYVWTGELHRPTKDIDVLYFSVQAPTNITEVFTHILTHNIEEDGLIFDPQSIIRESIREATAYAGTRVKITAKLGNALIPLQIDVGIGDSVYPLMIDHIS